MSQDISISLEFDDDRYSRLKLISWWDQTKLTNAKILVVGAGAIGNELIKNLALLGVGNIFIIDMDKIEHSNLTRSVLFRKSDVGRYKSVVAAERAQEINPDIKVKAFVSNVIDDLGLGFFRQMDVVLGGLDNREARLAINQFCFKVGVPWIDGAIEVFDGFVRVFSPLAGACYECTMSDLDWKLLNKRKSCALLSHEQISEGKTPTTPTSSSIIAGIQVQEALKILHNDRNLPNLIGKGFVFNGLTHDSYVVEYERKEDCLSHELFDEVIQKEWGYSQPIELILKEVKTYLGEEATLELDREIITKAKCACGHTKNIYKPVHKSVFYDLICEKCGRSMDFDTTHSFGDLFEMKHLSFKDIGLPPYHIVMGKNSSSFMYFEFSSDKDAVMSVQKGG